MTVGIIGKKIGMTRVFVEGGDQIPVTVVHVGPCTIIGKKTAERDQYTAVRVGYGERKEKHANKPMIGEAKKGGYTLPLQIKEFRVAADQLAKYEVGQKITADLFKAGDIIDASGVSKGKGFQGVVKMHGMAGFVEAHGSHEYYRHAGAIGQRKTPGRVFLNKRMPGHMGTDLVTIQKLKVVSVDAENGVVLVKGCLPGSKNGTVILKPSVKAVSRKIKTPTK